MSRHGRAGRLNPGLAAINLDQVRGRLLAIRPGSPAADAALAELLATIDRVWPALCDRAPHPNPACPPDPAGGRVEDTPARAFTLCRLQLGQLGQMGAAWSPGEQRLGLIFDALRQAWGPVTGEPYPEAIAPTT
jgi:hypothetical protein